MSQSNTANECVILLHGLGRTSRSMAPLKKCLEESGYRVANVSYPSTKVSIEEIADSVLGDAIKACQGTANGDKRGYRDLRDLRGPRDLGTEKLHFVTHSLGGILVRQYLQEKVIPNLGKIVMLAPPNQGSELADFLSNFRLFQFVLGPAGQQLGIDGVPIKLKSVPGTIGVIAGRASTNPLFSTVLPGENDGKVAVSSTRLKEMADFLVVDCGHTFMMRNREVLNQTLHFLKHGKFLKSDEQTTH